MRFSQPSNHSRSIMRNADAGGYLFGSELHCCMLTLICTSLLFLSQGVAGLAQGNTFLVKPYLQLGNNPKLSDSQSEELIWLSRSDDQDWKVEFKGAETDWHSGQVKRRELIDAEGHHVYTFTCMMKGLKPGTTYDYRILQDREMVFSSWFTSRKSFEQPYTFAVFGDAGAGSPGQRSIAYECYKAKPDLVVIPGDIVYPNGLLSEYLARFFPVYNCEDAAPNKGAPLMRSVLFAGVLGNHDIGLSLGYPTNLDKIPDALAYFFLLHAPLNGPTSSSDRSNIPKFTGTATLKKRFLAAAAERYPRMANYSFDYGNSHWLVLDGNGYMDWSSKDLRHWVEEDLRESKATWKFVTFHQPGFSCDTQHGHEQRMRLLSDIFESTNVDVVFSGHAHNYQRSYPLHFQASAMQDGVARVEPDGTVNGVVTLDKQYDGSFYKRPHGVIYIVTGGGGAGLYKMAKNLDEFETGHVNFLCKAVSNTHSFTLCHVKDAELTIEQIAASGKVIDSFTIAKSTP